MTTRAILAILCVLAAQCVSGYEPERAAAYFAEELAECGAWFTLVAEAPGLDDAARAEFRAAGISLVSSSADIISEGWALAQVELATEAIRREMDYSWKKFSAVNKNYGQRCRELFSYPVARRQYWLNKRD
jgi:hypothetical protein